MDGLQSVLRAYLSGPNKDGFMNYTTVECGGCVFRYNGDTLILIASAAAEEGVRRLVDKMKVLCIGNGFRVFTMPLPIESMQVKRRVEAANKK